jgi:hypothetical protein
VNQRFEIGERPGGGFMVVIELPFEAREARARTREAAQ